VSIAFAPDGRVLASGSSDHTVKLWNLRAGQEGATFRGFGTLGMRLAFSRDGNTLAGVVDDRSVRLWRAPSLQVARAATLPLVPDVGSSCGDQVVTLHWRRLPEALGYRIYRGPGAAAADELVKLAEVEAAMDSYTDRGVGLVNGRRQTYAVAGLFRGAGGETREGPRVTVQATPVATPPGFLSCSINEIAQGGSAAYQPASGEITLRAAESYFWEFREGLHYLGQPVTGDAQITVRMLTQPTGTDNPAVAGLMLRETLNSRTRALSLTTAGSGRTSLTVRANPTGFFDLPPAVVSRASLSLPASLRLIRRGGQVTAQYSQDGRLFQNAGSPITFAPPLPKTLFLGMVSTAGTAGKTSQARFGDIRIERL
jgi:hypothetical protein